MKYLSIEEIIELFEKDYRNSLKEEFSSFNTKRGYIGESIFMFTTYDSEINDSLVDSMVEVLECIVKGNTIEYQNISNSNYMKFIIMCNMPFLNGKLNWGASIRHAFIDDFETCEIEDNKGKIHNCIFINFVKAILKWIEV